jgi:NDP-sugar pyrophosphorylase family protein
MKTVVICPSDRQGVQALAEMAPLANLPVFGCSVTAHWLEYLAGKGAKQVFVLTADRAEEVRALLGDGARWGLEIEVMTESHDLTPTEARAKYQVNGLDVWLPAPLDIVVADCLPALPAIKLFDSYEDFFLGAQAALPIMAKKGRVGLREIKPGVWAGLHTHISDEADVTGPCWLGDGSHVEADSRIGPGAILEDNSWVGAGAEVSESYLGAETHLGVTTSLNRSLAVSNTLIDWRQNSVLRVTDGFLLCSLRAVPLRNRMSRMFNRVTEFITAEPRLFPSKSMGIRQAVLR